jgi:heat shock protein dnaJ domain protein
LKASKKEKRNFNEYRETSSNFSFMPDDIKNMFNSRFNMENISKINKENSEKYKKNIEKNFEDFFKMKKK